MTAAPDPDGATGAGADRAGPDGTRATGAGPTGSAADPLAGHPDTLRPLTDALIAAVLANRGHHVRAGPDGGLVGRWDDSVLHFVRCGAGGDLLAVRVLAAPTHPIEDVPALYRFCNGWNHDRLWPKAFVQVDDDGRARVCGEVVTDLARGVTPHQLDQLIDRGVSTCCQLVLALTTARLVDPGG